MERDSTAGATAGFISASTQRFVPANHLLNFQYDSARDRGDGGRGSRTAAPRSSGRASSSSRRGGGASGRPARYDRNTFLQANFRFLVSDAIEVPQFVANADKMFDWDDVVQVEMRSAEKQQCPISLDSPPVCPQITPCGHVYSYVAIMQHLIHHGGETLRRSGPCPLCTAPIVARDLRLVTIRPVGAPPVPGQAMEMTLLKRCRDSILPHAVGATAWAEHHGAKPHRPAGLKNALDDNRFAKFAVVHDASPYWHGTATQLAALAAQVLVEGGLEAAVEAPFIYAALDALALRARHWATHRAEALEQRHTHGAGAAHKHAAAASAPHMPPEAVGTAVEAAVKKVFNTTVAAQMDVLRPPAVPRAVVQAQVEPFPNLSAARGDAPPPAASSSPLWPRVAEPFKLSSAAAPFSDPRAPPHPVSQAATTTTASQAAQAATANTAPQAASAATGLSHPIALGSPPDAPAGQQHTTTSTGALAVPPVDQSTDDAAAGQQLAVGPTDLATPAAHEHDELLDPAFSDCDLEDEEAPPPGPPAGTPLGAPAGRDEHGFQGVGRHSGGQGGSGELLGAAEMADGGGSEAVLGTSPNTVKLNAPNTSGDFFCYQASDGQWLFLSPLNVRCLLQHYAAYDCCPPTIQAPVIETELVVQSEASRKRWRFLSHLPLGGTFRLVELDLSHLLPPEALAPFAEELHQREKERRRRVDEERRVAAAEVAAAAAAAVAKQGPSASELMAMPRLEGRGTAAQAEEDAALQSALDESASTAMSHLMLSSSPPASGVSFARMTKLGYAASGPALGSATPAPGIGPSSSAGMPGSSPPTPAGAWLTRPATASSPSAVLTTSRSPWSAAGKGSLAAVVAGGASPPGAELNATDSSGTASGAAVGNAKKGKKGVLLFSTAQRRY